MFWLRNTKKEKRAREGNEGERVREKVPGNEKMVGRTNKKRWT